MLLRILRTLIHVKPIQILNRIWRKRLSFFRQPQPPTSTSPLGEFEFLNTKGSPKGWNDPRFEKLWLYNLHYFDYIGKVKGLGEGEQRKVDIILRWIKENPKGWGNGWEPYPISLRVVNWIKWLKREVKVRGEGEEWIEKVEGSLCEQVEWLEKRLEYHLLANHLLANAKALVFAGKCLGNEKWYRKGMAIYKKQLPEQTCADGVNFERSPMYHSIILEDVLDCFDLLRLRLEVEEEDRQLFKEYAEKMLAGLKMLTGPDGKIAKFNDSTDGIAKTPSQLFAYAKELEVKMKGEGEQWKTRSAASGFVRMEKGAYCLIAKMGEIGPSYQPGHAHADTFTFELWKGQTKVIGDTGCSTYVPGSVRSYERSTAAHNTVVIDGQNSSEVWAAHRVARRVKKVKVKGDGEQWWGSYQDYSGFVVKRRLELTGNGLNGTDEVVGSGEHQVEVRFHLPPGIPESELTITCPGERIVEPCDFAEGWNKRVPGLCIIYRSKLSLPTSLTWTIS